MTSSIPGKRADRPHNVAVVPHNSRRPRRVLTACSNKLSEGTAPALTAEQRSYLAQAMDIAAGLDIVFGVLADAFADPISPSVS